MPLDRHRLYRPEAIEFQRRRLAGEIRLTQERRVLALSMAMLAAFVALAVTGWSWAVPVNRSTACAFVGADRLAIAPEAVPAGAALRHVRQSAPTHRTYPISHVSLIPIVADADAGCRAELGLRLYPLRQAAARVFQR